MSNPGKIVVGEKVEGKVERNIHGGLEVVASEDPDTSVTGRQVTGNLIETRYNSISYVGRMPSNEVALAVANQNRVDPSSQSRSSGAGSQRIGEGTILFYVVGDPLKTRLHLRLSPSQTVRDVMRKVSEKVGRGELNLQLKLGDGGKILNPDDTLASSGVVENTRLIATELETENVIVASGTAQKEH